MCYIVNNRPGSDNLCSCKSLQKLRLYLDDSQWETNRLVSREALLSSVFDIGLQVLLYKKQTLLVNVYYLYWTTSRTNR